MAQGATKKKSSAASNGKRVVTAEQWAESAFHTITCPSGAQVKIRIPDLSTMLAGDAVPEHLRSTAFKMISDELGAALLERDGNSDTPSPPKLNQEVLGQAVELHRWIVLQSVVEPALTEEMLDMVPAEDLEMIAAIARRERDTDALGVRLGVDPLSRWTTFRELHECAADCEACETSRRVFSSYGMDAV